MLHATKDLEEIEEKVEETGLDGTISICRKTLFFC